MYISIVILVVIASILMCGIVLIQESKGGGLAADYSSNNNILGAPKTTTFIENATKVLAGVMIVLSVLSVAVLPDTDKEGSVMSKKATEEKAINPNNVQGIENTSAEGNATETAPQAEGAQQ